ncbi:Kinesin-like protein kifc1 [Halocaridina rubra]|uniref:Kinesin-like protein n=1 Tax=Halocaridina rubra TaxID=373956 RepID=A0AAN8X242_HALRR
MGCGYSRQQRLVEPYQNGNTNFIEIGGERIRLSSPNSGRLISDALLKLEGGISRKPGTNITNQVNSHVANSKISANVGTDMKEELLAKLKAQNPNVARYTKVERGISDALQCYKEISEEKKRISFQTRFDKFFLKVKPPPKDPVPFTSIDTPAPVPPSSAVCSFCLSRLLPQSPQHLPLQLPLPNKPVTPSLAMPLAYTSMQADRLSVGKSKRPGWDLKGRLQDMEAQVKSATLFRNECLMKLKDCDGRIESLEQEKQNLNQDLVKTTNCFTTSREEAERLESQIRKHENTIESLQFSKSTLERQLKSTEDELSSRQDEVAGLKSSMSQFASAQAALEAQLTSRKILISEMETKLTEKDKMIKEMNVTLSEKSRMIEELNLKLLQGEDLRRKLHNTVQELKGNIRVFCRVRPLLKEELQNNGDSDVIHHINFLDEHTLEVGKGDINSSTMSGLKGRGNNSFEFSYDRVFNPSATQAEVFEDISQLSQSALDGYNVCIFAYGQTGSGKTYTMEGMQGDEALEGMIPRTVKHIFRALEELKEKCWTYKLEASFLEIYNETIRDLLATPKEAKSLSYEIKLQDNKKNEIYVTNLKSVPVEDERKLHTLLSMAQQQRAVAATCMNDHSSRSHSIFRLKIVGENWKTTESCEGTLSLVDLAGSERLKESKSEGARLTETQNINRSLADLGNVLMALGQKQNHIPYRNSKLTYLLQNSLGGNSKTLMFVNVSPLESCFNETLNSLRFATKVNQCHIDINGLLWNAVDHISVKVILVCKFFKMLPLSRNDVSFGSGWLNHWVLKGD